MRVYYQNTIASKTYDLSTLYHTIPQPQLKHFTNCVKEGFQDHKDTSYSRRLKSRLKHLEHCCYSLQRGGYDTPRYSSGVLCRDSSYIKIRC